MTHLTTSQILTRYKASCLAARTLARRALDSGTLPATVRLELEMAVACHDIEAESARRYLVAVGVAQRERLPAADSAAWGRE